MTKCLRALDERGVRMSANLPVSPSLRQLKAQAKELHKNARDGDAEAMALVVQYHTRSVPRERASAIGLQEAQTVRSFLLLSQLGSTGRSRVLLRPAQCSGSRYRRW